MAPRREDPDKQLERSLEQIDETADRICRGADLFDVDNLAQELSDGFRELNGVLAGLMADPARDAAARPAPNADDLAELCADAVRSTLASLTVPLCLRVVAGPPIPVTASEPSRAAIRRLVRVAVAHAGWDGVVILSPRTIGGSPALELAVRPGRAAHGTEALPANLRCRSLELFAEELGGALELRIGAADELCARLQLPSG